MIKGRIKLGHILICLGSALVIFWAGEKQTKSSFSKGDIDTYLNASRLLLAGDNIYAVPNRGGPDYYVYPPLLAALLIPLTPFPIQFVIYFWCALKIPLLVLTVRASYQVLTGNSFSGLPRGAKWTIGFFPVLMTARFILHDLSYGQVHVFLLGLTVLGLWLASISVPIGGGISIGSSFALKVVSIPLGIWFLVKSDFKVLIGTLTGALAGLLAPAVIVGFGKNLSYLNYWLQNIILDESARSKHWSLRINYSLHAQLTRFFSDTVAFDYAGQSYKLTMIVLPPAYLRIAPFAIMILVAASIAFYAFKYKNCGSLVGTGGGIALVFSLIPIFAPVTLEHHYLMLLPAHIYVVYLWQCMRLKDKLFRGLVIASFMLNTLTAELFVGNHFRDIFLAIGCTVWGTLLLSVSIFRAASCLATEADAQGVIEAPRARCVAPNKSLDRSHGKRVSHQA